jgi:hypothetical protein
MIMHREKCLQMATDDCARYTRDIAKILDVTVSICEERVPVGNRDEWCESLLQDHSNLQTQKFVFAWLYIRHQYKSLSVSKKGPDELFEDRFLDEHCLEYDQSKLMAMKKNTKTCVRLLYNCKVGQWRDKLFAHMKTKRNLQPSVCAPNEVRLQSTRFRREPNTFYIGSLDINRCWNYREVCVQGIQNTQRTQNANPPALSLVKKVCYKDCNKWKDWTKKTIYYLNEVQVAPHPGCVKIDRSHISYMSDLTEQKSGTNILPISEAMQEQLQKAGNNTSDEVLVLANLSSAQQKKRDQHVGDSYEPKPVEVSTQFASR